MTTDGAREIEMNITASAVLRAIGRLPEAQRETVLLVYGEGYSYAEAAAALAIPIGTVMSRLAAGARGAGETEIGAFCSKTMTDEDAELVALIDNELDEGSRDPLLARLAADERLRRRYDELRAAGAPIAASLDGAARPSSLGAPPGRDSAGRTRSPAAGPILRNGLRQLAAGIAIGLLAAGAAAWVASSFGLLGGTGGLAFGGRRIHEPLYE